MAVSCPDEGSVYREGASGRWRGAFTAPDGRRHKVSGRTKRQAFERLREAQAAFRNGAHDATRRLTLAGYLTEWLRRHAPARPTVRSVNTLDNYAWAINRHLVPRLGHLPLVKLTPEHVEHLLDTLAADGLSRSSISRVRATLVLALKHAVKRGLIVRNVAELADMPAAAALPCEGRALTPDQARALLATVAGQRNEALVVTGLMLGLRPGELLGLRWVDVDLDAAALHVRSSLKRERNQLRLGDPKTPRSRRSLNLPAPVLIALRAHRRRQIEDRLQAGSTWVDNDLVFCTTIGTAIDPSNLRREFSAMTTAAGLGHWTPNELRHSAASLLSATGVPLEHIADVLGHDGTRMTAVVYRHAVTPTVTAAVAPMEKLFG
jgi:integrase